jgi:ADP-ribose pyrophosphatase YjhB (NUDIX family)
VQVPAGTVEPGEGIEDALLREVCEETGIEGCSISRKLGVFEWVNPETLNTHERHVFLLRAPEGLPPAWTWVETSGGTASEENSYVFLYRWARLQRAPGLAGEQGAYLHLIGGGAQEER